MRTFPRSQRCVLCSGDETNTVWADARWRVIRVADPDFPAFYRIISRRHVEEFTMLDAGERTRCIELICAVETVLRQQLHPASVNLAALGNVVPHLHWHVVARFLEDSHFPEPIWGARQRELEFSALAQLTIPLEQLDQVIGEALRATGRTATSG